MKRLMAAVLSVVLFLGGVGGIGLGQAILVLDEQCGRSVSYFPRALDNLGYDYKVSSSREEFATALSEGGPWDVIVVDEYSSRLSADTLSALGDYVRAGGHLYMNYWDWADSLVASLGAALVPDSRYWKPLAIYAWEPTHPLFTTPNTLGSLVPADDTCDADGAKFEAAAGSLALAGYTRTTTTGEAAIIVGNEGRTVLFGGIIGLFSGDGDGDGRQDGLEFAENVIAYLVGQLKDPIPPPPVACPICDGKVYALGPWRMQVIGSELYIVATSGSVAFMFWKDSNGWFDVQEGDQRYTAWSVGDVTPDSTDRRKMPIQAILTAVPAGPARESFFTFGSWDVMFSTQGITLMNEEDVLRGDAYKGITFSRTETAAVFTAFTGKSVLFPQSGGGCPPCEVLFADISAEEVNGILDGMGRAYDLQIIGGLPVWFVTVDDEIVAIYPFSKKGADRFEGLQFVFFAFGASAEAVGRWNKEYRGTRAYIDDDGDAVLEAELFLAGGVSRNVIIESILRFERAIALFLDFIKNE